MKIQKYILKIVYCLAGLLFLVSVGINIYQYGQFKNHSEKPVSEKIVKKETVNDPGSTSESIPVKTAQEAQMTGTSSEGTVEKPDAGEIKELKYHLNAAEEELDMTNEQLSEELSKKEEFKRAWSQPGSNSSDPVYAKIRKDAYTKRINRDYDPLFKKLNISEENFNEFKDLLLDKEKEMSKLSDAYSSASSDEEKQKVIGQEMEINEKYNNRINDFFGEEKFEIYQSYVDRLPQRRSLTEFMETVPTDKRIGEEQTDDLIDSMYSARENVMAEMGPVKNNNSTRLTEEMLDESMKRQSRINEKYVEVSRGVMTPDQLEQYKAHLKRELEMQDAILKMSLYLNDKK